MSTVSESTLGKPTRYSNHRNPDLLFAIGRTANRTELGLGTALPFHGMDRWTTYELSWLDPAGKPQVAMAEFDVPANTPYLIESKSFKLYLNGFSGERMTEETVLEHLRKDLSHVAGAEVAVRLIPARAFATQRLLPPAGIRIDDLDLTIDHYAPPHPDFLRVTDAAPVHETLVSHLLKSNCPVTGQPDWASVQIRYQGAPIDRAGLLRYVVSFREHREFHEHCVERIFMDITRRCAPQRLSVYARYTRRGGLDINPFRSSAMDERVPDLRTARQ